jgi:hypothetical protein
MSLLWYFLSLWPQRGCISLKNSIKYVLSIVLTLESRANSRKYLYRLWARNKPLLLGQTVGSFCCWETTRMVFSVATVVNEKVTDSYFLVWCLPRQCWFAVLCRFWLQCSHGLRQKFPNLYSLCPPPIKNFTNITPPNRINSNKETLHKVQPMNGIHL